ncbi:TIGR04086 family membrane protein [Ruminiclostridium cellobioparum]|jgi:putative membrane protein (TIGR04086 family)|uniref:Putative membrane protein, TIGR04086 family n=1 Tax=Ruminiclostridium cellobioparum subsp. termitidis CT1112 TaxID=1195236 RepID=S0FTC8_RUMCE|nr:TIGR04086 family membrane protein [Ruminiclostridium cellobioparum]EMS71758.1 putative membrane protein, TIGR04086 family [Ruminiclostridium cellobioparum subsp. termitidis CT1112]
MAGQIPGLKKQLDEHVNLPRVLKGLILSFLITLPCFLGFALFLTYTDFPEKYTFIAVLITTVISVLTASAYSTRNVRSKGWMNGCIVGVLYVAILYLASSIVFMNFAIDVQVLLTVVIGAIVGCLGGIFGINLR